MKIFKRIILIFIKFLYKLLNCLLDLFRFLLFQRKKLHKDIKKILIFRVGHIGDIICAVPSMVAIRNNFPKAKIVLISSPGKRGEIGAKTLLENAVFLDRLIFYYQEEIGTLKKKIDFVKKLRKEKVDIFIELPLNLTKFHIEIRNIIFARLIGVKYAFGFRVNTIPLFKRIQSKYLKFDNEVERLLKIIRKEGFNVVDISFPLPILEKDKSVINNFLTGLNNKKLVAINPAAKRQTNLWHLDKFAEIGKWLIKKFNVQIVIIGWERDRKRTEWLNKIIGDGAVNVSGRFTPLQTVELLKNCRFLISNDTGAIHMASASGTSVIGIYSARDFKNKWYPYGEKNVVLRKEPKCHICFKEKCRDLRCLNMITVEEVKEAVKSLSLLR